MRNKHFTDSRLRIYVIIMFPQILLTKQRFGFLIVILFVTAQNIPKYGFSLTRIFLCKDRNYGKHIRYATLNVCDALPDLVPFAQFKKT